MIDFSQQPTFNIRMDSNSTLKEKIKNRWQTARKSFDRDFEQRVRDFVTLEMRRRGDYAGRFSVNEKTWRPGISSAVVSYPVIARSLRANTATSISTDIPLTFEPSTQHPAKRAAVELVKAIYKYESDRLWDEALESKHADLGQLGGFTAFKLALEEDTDESFGTRPAAITRSVELESDQMFACANCGHNYEPQDLGLTNINENGITEFSSQIAAQMSEQGMEDGDILKAFTPAYNADKTACPGCGGQLVPTNDPSVIFSDVPSGEEVDIYDKHVSREIISPLLIRFDPVMSVGFEYDKAEWFNHHYLVPHHQLRKAFPDHAKKIEGYSYSQWSDSVKWYYELSKPNLGQTDQLAESDERQYFAELDVVYFRPSMFDGVTAGEQDTFQVDGEQITVNKGEEYASAIEKAVGEKFLGLKAFFLHDELLGLETVRSDSDHWVLVAWRPNPTCAVPNGEERQIRLQDQITNIMSMRYAMVVRANNAFLVYDSKYFERADLTRNQAGSLLGTKPNGPDRTGAVTQQIGYVNPPPPNDSDMAFLQLCLATAKEESGVYDETVGNTDSSNKTARGRELAINQSLGLLGVTQKAKKLGKVKFFRNVLRLWQQKPDECFRCLAGIYEDGVTPTDIEDFKSLKLDKDVQISAVQGADIPKSTPDMFNAYQIALQLGLFIKDNPLSLEHRQYIVRNVLGLPIDLENYEADRRIASERVSAIKRIIQSKGQELAAEGFDVLTVDFNEFQQPEKVLHPDIVAAISVDPQTQITTFDNHTVCIEYYNNQLKGLVVAKQRNEPLISALRTQIKLHGEIMKITAMQEMASGNMMMQAGAAASDPQLQGNGQPMMQPAQQNPETVA